MTEPENTEPLIAQLHARIIESWRLIALQADDAQLNHHLIELAEMTRCLAQAPARTLGELEVKLSVLCARLREDLRPDVRGEVVTWMLAESLRHDCYLIAPLWRSSDAPRNP
ncbi:MAG: hypothetical protein ACI82H_001971 [Alphaproteobacteria bacterium]|jgi:hypothetical protein